MTPRFNLIRPTLRFLGSLQLAMILLAVIIVACAVGTVTESRFDAAIAQTYIYDAPWFTGWLLLLCLNLVCVVLVRYPWKAHQTGFIITHAGIVVLMIGAMIGRIWGVEGSITLFKGAPPANQMIANQTVVEVHASGTAKSKSKVLNLEVEPPSAKQPVRFRLKGSEISLVDFAKTMGVQTIVERTKTNGSPAVRVALSSPMIPQPVHEWLLLGDPKRDRLDLGPAQIQFAAQRASSVTKPAAASISAQTENITELPAIDQESREKHFVFAKMPEMNIARVLTGQPTGINAHFRFPQNNEKTPGSGPTLELKIGDRRFEYLIDDIMNRRIALEGTDWTLERLKFLPDFRTGEKEPISHSDQPNNPALVFEISGKPAVPLRASKEECDHKDGKCDHSQKKACCPESSEAKGSPHVAHINSGMTIYFRADGKLSFETVSNGQLKAARDLEVGEEFSIGLADWKIQVEELVEHAAIRDELGPMPEGQGQSSDTSGILVEIKTGQTISKQWIASGEQTELRAGREVFQMSFGQRVHPLGFGVTLQNFEVERVEGTQNPAGFKSRVRFAGAQDKNVIEREIWMNHPANYPEFPGVGLLGTAYKFSQASWNPNNLNQTTLQVIRDPGWSLKWIGSLLVCGGLFTMFYLKPYPRRNPLRA